MISCYWVSSRRGSSQTPAATRQEPVGASCPSRRQPTPPTGCLCDSCLSGRTAVKFSSRQNRSEKHSEGQRSCRTLSGRCFDGLTPPLSPTSSPQIARTPTVGLDVWPPCPLGEALPSSQLKTVLHKNKTVIKDSSMASHQLLMGKFV